MASLQFSAGRRGKSLLPLPFRQNSLIILGRILCRIAGAQLACSHQVCARETHRLPHWAWSPTSLAEVKRSGWRPPNCCCSPRYPRCLQARRRHSTPRSHEQRPPRSGWKDRAPRKWNAACNGEMTRPAAQQTFDRPRSLKDLAESTLEKLSHLKDQ